MNNIKKIINDFDANIYKKLNPDLQILSENEAKIHYIKYGKK